MVARNLSNTPDTDFCVVTLEEALGKGRPEVFHTDQGSQFTGEAPWSQNQHGREREEHDNIFVERLWRT